MLAKVAAKRSANASDFGALIDYISDRDNDDKEDLRDELDPSNRQRHLAFLERAGDYLRAARHDLQATGRADAIDANAVRIRAARATGLADTHGPGADVPGQPDPRPTKGGVNDDPYQRSLSRSRENIGAAADYLRFARETHHHFQERARARRANLAFHADAVTRQHGRHRGDAAVDFESPNLDELAFVRTSSGIVCRHNCLSLATAGAEMKAVAAQNGRVVDPVYHVILSWPAGERPSDGQAFACGEHALESVGMGGHQHVFAIHRDTRHVHMHIAVNRVHPESFRAVYPSRDFYKLDRAMRELEVRFGWRHDKGPFAVYERDGTLVVDWAGEAPASKERMPSGARDMERHGDQESLFSYARGRPREELVRVLADEAVSWQSLHAAFAKFGLALREKGRGLAVYEASSPTGLRAGLSVKASDVHEDLSKSRLVARLGAFECATLVSVPVDAYDKFRAPVRNPGQRSANRQARADARRDLRTRFDVFRNGIVREVMDAEAIRIRFRAIRAVAIQRRQNARLLIPDRAARKVQYSVIAFETARELERLRAQVRNERAAMRSRNKNASQSFRKWVEQQAALGDAAALAQLRGWAYAQVRERAAIGTATDAIAAEKNGFRPLVDADRAGLMAIPGIAFTALRDGTVRYRLVGNDMEIVDHGDFIEVVGGEKAGRALVAGVLIAVSSLGEQFEVEGNQAFCDAVAALRERLPDKQDLLHEWNTIAHDAPQVRNAFQPRAFTPDRI